ncbi:hypothetical protein ABKV19_027318 [Rosa sericea]
MAATDKISKLKSEVAFLSQIRMRRTDSSTSSLPISDMVEVMGGVGVGVGEGGKEEINRGGERAGRRRGGYYINGGTQNTLPLLLRLLFLSALSFFSYHHSSLLLSLSNPNPNPNPNLTLHPQIPNFTFTIKVLAYNRLDSLSRCLRSLAAADYLSNRVHLYLHIDHFPLSEADDADRKLQESRRILDFVDGFEWKFSEKVVHYWTQNAGLQAQWLEAWWSSSDHEFAFVVEDDLEVSPLYYKFLKNLIVNYYYNASNSRPYIYGASLQRPRFLPGKHGNKLQLDDRTRLFFCQLVGTWGQLLFPKPWKEFRLWYDKHKAKGIKPILNGTVTTGWYKKMGEKIWTPFLWRNAAVAGIGTVAGRYSAARQRPDLRTRDGEGSRCW